MKDKIYLLFPHGNTRIFFLFKLLKQKGGIQYYCRARYAIIDGEIKLLMKTFQKGIFDEDDDITKHSIKIGYELTQTVKAELLLMGFRKIKELQEIVKPELFENTDTTEFIYEQEFERMRIEHFDLWLSQKEPNASIDDFEAHLPHIVIP